MKISSWLVPVLKVLFSAFLIGWFIKTGHLDLSNIKYLFTLQYGLLGLLLVMLGLFLASERWRYLMKSQNISASTGQAFRLTFIGAFFNFAVPGGVGGDMVKAFYFYKEIPQTRTVALTSVLMDRVFGLYSMILMALIAMLYDYQHVITVSALNKLFYAVAALFFITTIGLLILFSKKIYQKGYLFLIFQKLPFSKKLTGIYESVHLYGQKPAMIFIVILLSLIAQSSSILFLYIMGQAASYELALSTYFLVAPLGFMATAIPISPAGIGVGQAAFYFLFNLYTGQVSEVGPTTVTIFQFATFLLSLIGAFFYIRRKDKTTLIARGA